MRDNYTVALQERIKTLEHELLKRPSADQVAYLVEYAHRQKAKYEAVSARNIVLKRKLDEANAK